MTIRPAESDAEVAACFAVLKQLRPSLVDAADLLAQVRRQEARGYRLAVSADGDRVLAVAGYWLGECLAWGKYLFVDDLVTDDAERSKGHGEALLDWLVELARSHECRSLQLDSGVHRFAAHRFYLCQRMSISSHHFSLDLSGG